MAELNLNFLDEVSNRLINMYSVIDTMINQNTYYPGNEYGPNNTTEHLSGMANVQTEYTPENSYDNILTAYTNRAEKIGKYLLSSKGVVFMATQAMLHLANYRTSRILDPLVYEIGGFGILPDTFDALLVKYEDTVAKEPGQGMPGIGIYSGKHGAAEQIFGPFGFVTPRSGLMDIVGMVGKLLGLAGGSSLIGVVLDDRGAVDFSKTPLTSALKNINHWSPSEGLLDVTSLSYGNSEPGLTTEQGNLDGYQGLVIALEDASTGKVKLLIRRTKDSIKDKDGSIVKETVYIDSTSGVWPPGSSAISKYQPLSRDRFNVITEDRPYTNLYRPLKLLSDIGFGKNGGSLVDTIKSSYLYEKVTDSKDPKLVNTKQVKISLTSNPDPLRAQFELDNRQIYTYEDGKLVLSDITPDEIAASYPVEDILPFINKTYVPMFFKRINTLQRTCFFRAYINTLGESYSPSWNEENSYGRSQEIAIYQHTGRTLELNFTVYAGHPKELVPMYARLNWLVRNTYPSYSYEGMLTEPPIMKLTIGDMYVGLPVYITNLSIEIPTDAMWEVEPGSQVPIILKLSLSLGVLHERMPSAGGYFYKLAKTGVGTTAGDVVGTTILYDDTQLSKVRGM